MAPSTDPVAFFKNKRPWSLQKDRILQEYVPSYLQKVSRYPGLPVLFVDGFAGPGKFQSGEPGSPLILAKAIQNSGVTPPPELIALEPHIVLSSLLADTLSPFPFATVKRSELAGVLPDIRKQAIGKTTFLYLDPFAIAGLDWAGVTSVLELIRQGHSVELLLNFNAHAFVRRARSSLALETTDVEDLDDADFEEWRGQDANADRLDAAVGGGWWRAHVSDDRNRVEQAGSIVRELARRLREICKEVCFYEVYERWTHRVPKYFLVFATRSPVALVLMNHAMCKGHEEFLKHAAAQDLPLFGSTAPTAFRREPRNLEGLILEEARDRIVRPALIKRTIARLSREQGLGMVSTGDLKRRLTEMRDRDLICTEPAVASMNDDTIIWSKRRGT